MSYLVLARKYRPQSFSALVGQEHVARTLGNAIQQGRIPQAVLLTGIRGVGKTSVARIFARALNCVHGPTATPCEVGEEGRAGVCAACAEMVEGRAIDVIEIDGASNNGVDQVRDLRENVKYLPQSGRYKIYIIDEVHMLTQAAFNALLKTLEEPPAHVVFVFATTEAHRLPATILSRCQRFDLRKIRTDVLVERLRAICRAETIEADDEALLVIAREGAGSLRDAVSLLDQVISYGSGRVVAREVIELLGVLDRRALLDLARAIAAHDCDAALAGLRAFFDHGYEVRPILDSWLVVVRNLAVAAWSKNRELLPDLSNDEAEDVAALAATLPPGLAERWYAITERSFGDVVHASDPVVSLEVLVLRLLRTEALRSVDDLLADVKAIEVRLGGAGGSPRVASVPASAPATASALAPASAPAPAHRPPDFTRWGAIVDAVRATRPHIAAILDKGGLARCDEGGVIVNFDQKMFLVDKVDEPASRAAIVDALRGVFGVDVPFSTVRVDRVEAGRSLAGQRAEACAADEAKARTDLLANPVVSAVKSIFEAEVREVRAVKPADAGRRMGRATGRPHETK